MILPLQQITFEALGTAWNLQYASERPDALLPEKISREIMRINRLFSRFDPGSQLSQLNKNRHGNMTPEFMELFVLAEKYVLQTDGRFTPLASPMHFGYVESFLTHVPVAQKSQHINMDWHLLKRHDHTLTLAPGQFLDFGGIGKGYLIDRLMPILLTASPHVLIDGGGDIRVAGGDGSGGAWRLGLEDPTEHGDERILELWDGALATSGTYRRKWGAFHHLISAQEGGPKAHAPLAISAQAPTATLADVAATTLMVTPADERAAMASKLQVRWGSWSKSGWSGWN